MSEEFKVIRVSMPTYGYLMDNRTLYYKSMDSVIWQLIDDKGKAENKIKELEAKIVELESELKERVRLEGSQV